MADIALDQQTAPTAPGGAVGIVWVDSTADVLALITDGNVKLGSSNNASVASQGAGFASDTYVTNSDIKIPSWGLQPGDTITWVLNASKTNAGTAAPVYTIRIGAARTTADTSRLAITGSNQSAAVDIGVCTIGLTVRSVSASGVLQGTVNWAHNGAGTEVGFCTTATTVAVGTSAGFDNTAQQGLFIGLSINAGTNAAWTLTQCRVIANWGRSG